MGKERDPLALREMNLESPLELQAKDVALPNASSSSLGGAFRLTQTKKRPSSSFKPPPLRGSA